MARDRPRRRYSRDDGARPGSTDPGDRDRAATTDPGRDGRRRLQLDPRARSLLARAARGRLRDRPRLDPRSQAVGRRPGGHARRAMAAFPSQAIVRAVLDRYFRVDGRGRSVGRRTTRHRRAQGPRYKLAPLLRHPLKPERTRADRPGELRRGVPREGGPRRRRRDQLPREDPVPDAAQPVRRDAGRRRRRPDGRRDPDRDPGRPRPAQPSTSTCRSRLDVLERRRSRRSS